MHTLIYTRNAKGRLCLSCECGMKYPWKGVVSYDELIECHRDHMHRMILGGRFDKISGDETECLEIIEAFVRAHE